jgi:hypothetical protein
MRREFLCDVARGRGMAGKIGQCAHACVVTLRIGAVQQRFRSGLVARGIEAETVISGASGRAIDHAGDRTGPPIDAPAGEKFRERDDVGLRIAAVDAERVQLQNFAAEIFVEPFSCAPASHRIRADRLRVVQINLHRGMALDGQHHVGKFSRDVRAYRFALEGADEQRALRLRNRDREMVAPEIDQPFAERLCGFESLEETRRHFAQVKLARLHQEVFDGLRVLGLARLLAFDECGDEIGCAWQT